MLLQEMLIWGDKNKLLSYFSPQRFFLATEQLHWTVQSPVWLQGREDYWLFTSPTEIFPLAFTTHKFWGLIGSVQQFEGASRLSHRKKPAKDMPL